MFAGRPSHTVRTQGVPARPIIANEPRSFSPDLVLKNVILVSFLLVETSFRKHEGYGIAPLLSHKTIADHSVQLLAIWSFEFALDSFVSSPSSRSPRLGAPQHFGTLPLEGDVQCPGTTLPPNMPTARRLRSRPIQGGHLQVYGQ